MASSLKNKHLINIYTNYVDLLYYEREKSNTGGTFLIGEVNALSASTNEIWDGKSKKKEKKSVQFLTRRDPEKIYARSSQWYKKLQKQRRKFPVLSKSMIMTKNNHFVTIEIYY